MTENDTVRAISEWPVNGLTGRRKIYTTKKRVTPENVVEVLGKALAVHRINRAEMSYLYDYYRGKQDIRLKDKIVRPEINNKVMINRANEIVVFKSAYLLDGPIRYVSNGGEDDISASVNTLNEYMRSESKDTLDKELADWMHICGVAVRMVLPDEAGEEDGSPASIYTLDPRAAFCIYHSGVGQKKVAGVLEQVDEEGKPYFCVYTPEWYFEVQNGQITKQEARTIPYIPIVEYVNNDARMGAFEPVIPILNAINMIESNRLDSIQDFVNAYDVFQNCELEDGQYKELAKGGMAIKIRSFDQTKDAKVYRIASELNQTNTQTIVDDLEDAYLTICGMPNRNGGSSTSDTGQAVIYRDGWSAAESRAKDTEKTWERSEREFLRLVLYICRETGVLGLQLADIKPEFTRKNLSNIQSKAQVLAEMLNNSKIHPKLAFQYSGLFSDPEDAYRISMEYAEEQQRKMERSLRDELNANRNESVQTGGQSNRPPEQPSSQAV